MEMLTSTNADKQETPAKDDAKDAAEDDVKLNEASTQEKTNTKENKPDAKDSDKGIRQRGKNASKLKAKSE